MRRLPPHAIAAFLVACCCTAGRADDPPPPQAPPAESVKAVESLFGEQIRQATQTRDHTDDIQLAAEMLDTARMLKDKPSVIVLLCQRAYELADSHPDGYPTAIAATRLATERMPESRAFFLAKQLPLRLRLYDSLSPDEKSTLADDLINDYLRAADDRIEIGDFDGAVRAILHAIDVATSGRPERRNELQAEMGRVRHLQRLSRQAESYRKLLEIKPHHEQAHRRLMRIHLVEFDQPVRAIDHADAVGTELERRLVPLATQTMADLGEADLVALGEFYRRLSGEGSEYARPVMLRRADTYFQYFHDFIDEPNPRLAIRARVMQQDVRRQLKSLGIEPLPIQADPAATQPAEDAAADQALP